jgi:hypothetical protein
VEDSAFSDQFCRFIQTCVTSVEAAELLLLQLSPQPDRWFEPAELARSLGPGTSISESDLSRYLEQFQAGGLVTIGQDKRVRYRADSQNSKHVEMLAQAYKERPVTLFRVIYALRDLKIQSFADAFKLIRK